MNSSELRVIFLSDATRGRNGVGTYYQDLVEQLEDRVERAVLLSPATVQFGRHEGLSVPLPGDSTQRLFFPKVGQLSKNIRDIAPYVIVVPTLGPYGISGLRLAKRSGAALCVACHTDLEKLALLYWRPVVGTLCKRFLRSLAFFFFRAGSLVVTNNTQMAMAIREAGIPDVRIVGTPIAKRFLNTPALPLSSELRSILFAGRLALEKNVDSIIEAAASLPSFRFVIAGDGPRRDFVVAKAKELDNLDYIGWVSREQVMAVLDSVDLLVLPSSIESFGTAALEAMSRKRLVLVSPHCGIADDPFFADGIFQMRATETLSQAIERIANLDYAKRREVADTAYRCARTLSFNAVDQWLDILAGLVAGSPVA